MTDHLYYGPNNEDGYRREEEKQMNNMKRKHDYFRGHQDRDQHIDSLKRFAGQSYLEGPGFTKDFFEDQSLNKEYFDENFPEVGQFTDNSHYYDPQKNNGKRQILPHIHRLHHNKQKLNKGFFDENFPGVIAHNDDTFAVLPERLNQNSLHENLKFGYPHLLNQPRENNFKQNHIQDNPNIAHQHLHNDNQPQKNNLGNHISGNQFQNNQIMFKRNKNKLQGNEQNHPNRFLNVPSPSPVINTNYGKG